MSLLPREHGASDNIDDTMLRIPPPPYRHASPAGPWPWMNIDSDPEPPGNDLTAAHPEWAQCSHSDETCGCWTGYPESRFPNWKPAQVGRSGMMERVSGSRECVIRHVDVDRHGHFTSYIGHTVKVGQEDVFWKLLHNERREHLRVRALFVESLSEPVLKMLGTKYNIEPFFFTSSLNWIPSRFQAGLKPEQEDYITITLTFVRTIESPPDQIGTVTSEDSTLGESGRVIDTQAPLRLRFEDKPEQHLLIHDLLAIHMVRNPDDCTIISYHPSDQCGPAQPHTSAERLHSRIDLAGQSVYWSYIFQNSDDPTFVLLAMLWHALYAWDETFEILWEYIMELESSVIETNDMLFTRELHELRARLLHYSSLLMDFRTSVQFILETPNPVMDSKRYTDKEREFSRDLLKKECNNLIMEVDRLKQSRDIQDKRLKNVMNLVFSKVNIDDSKRMQEMTQAAVRDSAAMRQIALLTMVFLPAGFCAGIFGMNVQEINPGTTGTLGHYAATAVPFTAVTIWAILAFQSKWYMSDDQGHITIWTRLMWPFTLLGGIIARIWRDVRRQTTSRGFSTRMETIRHAPGIRQMVGNDESAMKRELQGDRVALRDDSTV